jgi:hypothetical protein
VVVRVSLLLQQPPPPPVKHTNVLYGSLLSFPQLTDTVAVFFGAELVLVNPLMQQPPSPAAAPPSPAPHHQQQQQQEGPLDISALAGVSSLRLLQVRPPACLHPSGVCTSRFL